MANREIDIRRRRNERGIDEHYITGHHVNLQTLKGGRCSLSKKMKIYLDKKIPPYPSPVKFWVSHVAHVTEESGFTGILESEGFRPPNSEFSWWDLKITGEEIKKAEKRYRKKHQVNQEEEFLHKFTTSPAFKNESRYGNYHFTFPLTDLMDWYKEQNCGGEEPVLRVYETVTYKQEIMYTVLIHSPEDNERFGEYPLLTESDWVRYERGKIIWKAQAICETHRYQIVDGKTDPLPCYLFYVWNQVSLVFHVQTKANAAKVLKIPRKRLIKALEVCKLDENIHLRKYQGPKYSEEQENLQELFNEAVEKVSELKRELEEDEEEESIEEDEEEESMEEDEEEKSMEEDEEEEIIDLK